MVERTRLDDSGDRDENCTRTGAVTAQPRPALGRRPWFALLRLARNFRRFALAMAGRIPGAHEAPAVVHIHDPLSGWSAPPVLVARSFRRRLTGLRPWTLEIALLLPGGRITGRRMAEPLMLVGLSGDGRVTALRNLAAGGSAIVSNAAMILEMGAGHPPPVIGSALRVRPMLAPCRGD